MNYPSTIVRAAAWAILPIAAFAQTEPNSQVHLDALDAQAAVPALHYESTTSNYRVMNSPISPTKEWRGLNDTVGSTGSMSSMMMGGTMSGMEHGSMKNMDHPAMEGMKGMSAPAVDREPHPKANKYPSAKASQNAQKNSMSGMDMSSDAHSQHQTGKP